MHTRKLLFLVVTIAMLFGLVAVVSAATASVASRLGVAAWGPMADEPTGLDDARWGAQKPAVATWVHPSWPTLDGAVWISTADKTETPIDTSWRKFHDEFVIPATAYGIGANVKVSATADNAEAFYFDGVLKGSDGEVFGPSADDQEWNTIREYAVTPHTGTNKLDFIVRNYRDQITPETNPTGLLYKMSVDYSTPTIQCLTPAVTFQLMAGANAVLTQQDIKVLVNGNPVTAAFANGVYTVPSIAGDYTVVIRDGFVETLELGSCSGHVDPGVGFVTGGGTINSPAAACRRSRVDR